MAYFDEALVFVLRNEDPHVSGVVTEDSGGRTRFGIAERFHADLGNAFYTESAETALDIAREIYRSEYWNPICGDEIRDQQVGAKMLDMAVNMGVRQAIMLCQRALNACATVQLAEDDVLGSRTMAAINGCDAAVLLIHMREMCAAFYQHLAAARPEMQEYLRGWLTRARA